LIQEATRLLSQIQPNQSANTLRLLQQLQTHSDGGNPNAHVNQIPQHPSHQQHVNPPPNQYHPLANQHAQQPGRYPMPTNQQQTYNPSANVNVNPNPRTFTGMPDRGAPQTAPPRSMYAPQPTQQNNNQPAIRNTYSQPAPQAISPSMHGQSQQSYSSPQDPYDRSNANRSSNHSNQQRNQQQSKVESILDNISFHKQNAPENQNQND
jgi:hypothetical protein